ncbi:unnamed protein product [Psylliodes chrysocephalus]|uniref:A-kinase anchor protein 2 C-terminal domain-containing protein n=1 Tax=Psylliodes chrysocephalus TaxID=3402493 RepID=A0A9P0G7A2_9CUCU|nr:unnamed protein product [Psylliodes chrysocephala]
MNLANNTLERIQKEIRDNIQREKELKNGNFRVNEDASYKEVSHALTNGMAKLKLEQENELKNGHFNLSNGSSSSSSNGFTRRFIPNTNTKGMMQKFFRSRGKVGSSINSVQPQNGYSPVRFRVEKGQTLRNGYVPAQEKIVKELLDFQLREKELRNERMKSQPDLMAALELEESQINGCKGGLKSAKSMTNLFQSEDTTKNCYSLPSR